MDPLLIGLGCATLGGLAGFAVCRLFTEGRMLDPNLEKKLLSTLRELEKSSDRPKSEAELLERLDSIARNLQGRYDVLTNNLAAAVIVYDEQSQIRFASPYTEVLTGHSPSEFYERGFDLLESIGVGEDSQKYARAKLVSKLGEDFHLQHQIQHKSGIKLWLDTRFVPIFDDRRDVAGLLCVTIDVTESIRQRKQLEEQNQDLSDFSYMISHDLKAPIFTIKGMVAAIREDFSTVLGEDGLHLLQYIQEGATRLEKLVSSVIEYSAISAKDLSLKPVDLHEVFESVVKDLREQIRLSSAQIILPDALPFVSGDSVRYYQVFSNLIGNAIKYRSPSRALRIIVRAEKKNNDTVRIDIADNGLGIPENKVKDIFRPYHRAHSSEIEGSGIGLASVKKIVDRVGGQVSVESIEHEGSIFTVTLPASKEQSAKINSSRKAAA